MTFQTVQSGLELFEPIEVRLKARMQDGEPIAVLVQPLTPLEWAAEGRSIPAALTQASNQAGLMTPDDVEESAKFIRRIVARAVTHISAIRKDDDGSLSRFWEPLRLVVEEPEEGASPQQVAMRKFDRGDNVTRCWNAIMSDLDSGSADLEAVDGKTF